MPQISRPQNQQSPLTLFLFSFVIPIVILTRFSSESSLGPIKAMLLALAFPVVLELRNLLSKRKASLLSIIAIGGILVTGAISLLGLSEEWLALRRSVPYLAVSAAILISIKINRPLVQALLPQMIDIEKVIAAAKHRKTERELAVEYTKTGYMISVLFLLISLLSYVLTRVVIDAETGSSLFNKQYAHLRLLSIPVTTLPLLLGVTGIIMYLFSRIERLTGLDSDELMKKKK